MAHKPHIPNATYQSNLILQTKHDLPFGSREENLKIFLLYMGMVPILVKFLLKQNVLYCFI